VYIRFYTQTHCCSLIVYRDVANREQRHAHYRFVSLTNCGSESIMCAGTKSCRLTTTNTHTHVKRFGIFTCWLQVYNILTPHIIITVASQRVFPFGAWSLIHYNCTWKRPVEKNIIIYRSMRGVCVCVRAYLTRSNCVSLRRNNARRS